MCKNKEIPTVQCICTKDVNNGEFAHVIYMRTLGTQNDHFQVFDKHECRVVNGKWPCSYTVKHFSSHVHPFTPIHTLVAEACLSTWSVCATSRHL